jgi:peptidoglycan DL-endopeptidase CwlO
VSALNAHTRAAVVVCVALAIVLSSGTTAFASPLSDKQAQAAAVQAQISDLTTKAEIASQQYDAALGRYQVVSTKIAAIQQRIGQLKSRTDTLQTALGGQADEMYREDGPVGVIDALLSVHSIEDFYSTIELITRIGEQNAATIDQLKGIEKEAVVQKQLLLVAQATAGREKATMAANAQVVKARLADSEHVLATVQADIKAILAAQAAAEAAAARARAAALYRGGAGSIPFDPGGNPPTSSKGAAAVWWAEKALGRPYRWGASGPYAFD